MLYPYGYFADSMAVDGDGVDCYLGPHEASPWAFVVKQLKPKTGEYDEPKVMMGFRDGEEAKIAYLKHYDKPGFYGGMTRYPTIVLRNALKESKYNPAAIKSRLIRNG